MLDSSFRGDLLGAGITLARFRDILAASQCLAGAPLRARAATLSHEPRRSDDARGSHAEPCSAAWVAAAERWLEWLWPLQPSDRPGTPVADLAPGASGSAAVVGDLADRPADRRKSRVTHGVSDFRGFYQASQFTLAHGLRLPDTTFAFYLPSLDVAFEAIAWMPMPVAAVIWYLLGCWSWIALLRSVNCYLLEGFDEPRRRAVTFIGGLLMTPLAVDGLCLGSFQTFMVWWIVAGLGRIRRGRPGSGGFLLGLAVWIKLLPLLGVAYLVLKRQWKPAVLAVSLRGGARRDVEPRRIWAETGLGGTCPLVERTGPGHHPAAAHQSHSHPGIPDTNQSLAVILRRTLTTMGINQVGGAP